MAKAAAAPELAGLFSGYQVNVPQLDANIDRTKARQLGVAVTDVFDTLQIYLGSLYVNDFNAFGRTYSVRVEADAPFRARADDISRLEVRSASGAMVPLRSEEHTSELQSLMRISYAVFCLKKKNIRRTSTNTDYAHI